MPARPVAFLSYTRIDDQAHDGLISELRNRLEMQVRALTGDRDFRIFQDVDGIKLGEAWEGALERAIETATFFIPILSPSYFASEPCRFELTKFHGRESASGRDDLILPIYLIEVDKLENEALRHGDPLAGPIAARNRFHWREMHSESFDSPAVKRRVRELALAVKDAIARAPVERPAVVPAVADSRSERWRRNWRLCARRSKDCRAESRRWQKCRASMSPSPRSGRPWRSFARRTSLGVRRWW